MKAAVRGVRMSRARAVVIAAMIAVVGLAAGGQRLIVGSAFAALEADTVAADANRVAVALSYETALLRAFGVTNTRWDDSYQNVVDADASGLMTDFPATSTQADSGVDGILGVDAEGRFRVGGVISGGRYVPPSDVPPALTGRMVDAVSSGRTQCGLVTLEGAPHLYCGFRVTRSDGSAPQRAGLVVLRAVDAQLLASVSTSTRLPLTTGAAPAPADAQSSTLQTTVGQLRVSTHTVDDTTTTLVMSLATIEGGSLDLLSSQPRPIHATDAKTAVWTFLLLGAAMVIVLGLLVVLVRRSMSEQTAPLLATTEQIIDTGDPTVRLEASGKGDIHALARAINRLLDSSVQKTAEHIEAVRVDRERRVIDSYQQQQESQRAARLRAEGIIVATATAVTDQLREVLQQAEGVIDASQGITAAAAAADAASDAVLHGAGASEQALAHLTTGMSSVRGVTATITTITEKTHMLGLNAEIEAGRVGEAGAGFNVVAQEMRALAATTAASADRIGTTIADVSMTTTRISEELAHVTDGVDAVKNSSTDIRRAAERQRDSVAELISKVESSIERVSAIQDTTSVLESRDHERVPVFASGAAVLPDGTRYDIDLRDISAGGAQFEMRPALDLPVGQRLRLELPCEVGDVPPVASVVWARTRQDRTLVGVRLHE